MFLIFLTYLWNYAIIIQGIHHWAKNISIMNKRRILFFCATRKISVFAREKQKKWDYALIADVKNMERFTILRVILAPGPCQSSLYRSNFSICIPKNTLIMASLQLIYHDHSACQKIIHMRFTLTNVQTTSGDDEKGKKKFLLIACHQTLQPVKQWSSFSQDHQLWARAKSPLQYVNERTMSKNTHFITPGGTRTHNLWIRSPTPYPLGHRGCVEQPNRSND